jgi:hypothetical protein
MDYLEELRVANNAPVIENFLKTEKHYFNLLGTGIPFEELVNITPPSRVRTPQPTIYLHQKTGRKFSCMVKPWMSDGWCKEITHDAE